MTEVVRLETEGMTVTATLSLPDTLRRQPWGMCLSPDGKTLYLSADEIQEIDTNSWQVRRKLPARGAAAALACGPDGKLYEVDAMTLTRTDPAAPGAPTVQKFSLFEAIQVRGLVVSPDGKRLYATSSDSSVFSFDVREAFEFGRFVVAPKSLHDPARGIRLSMPQVTLPGTTVGGVISPDGKCLLLRSGQVYWLTGAGPLPEVDAAVKWTH